MKIVQITTDSREHFKDYDRPEPYFGTAPEALLSGFSGMPGIEIHVVSCVRQPVASPEKIAGNIFYHSLNVSKSGWMSTGYQGCFRAVRSLLAGLRPDIVHGQGTERDCAMDAVHSGFPNVLTIHGNMRELQRLGLHGHPLFGRLASMLETHAMKRSLGVFCNSAYTRSLVAPRARATWLVPNAIRAEFLNSPKTGTPEPGIPQLLNVGLIGPRKRQLEILRTVGEVVKAGHPMKILFVGGLSEHTPYGKAFADELRIAEAAGYAEYAGFLSAGELIDLMDQSQGFIHFPSEEAFGLVVAEAMARGLKFFGANLGGIVDIAQEIPGAELHESFEGLKAGLAAWAKSGASRTPDAATEIAARYAPEVVARSHIDIYQNLLGK